MKTRLSRREFGRSGAALSLSALLAGAPSADVSNPQHLVIRADSEIGLVRPAFHGQFAEHLGSCIYGGIWVGKNSPIENISGYRKQAVDDLRALGVPLLRWPGGCFADDYHWRDGIGPAVRRPKRVNIHWGGDVEDNSFGTHEFIGFCRLIGAEPYFAGNVGSGSPAELRDWIEYCNYPSGSTLSDERRANGANEPFAVRLWGVGNESWGCGGMMRPQEYADSYRRFAGYLRAFPFGGTRPFLVASGPNRNDANWSRGVMDGMRPNFMPNGFSMHYYQPSPDTPAKYTPGPMNAQLSEFAKMEQAIVQQRDLLNGYSRGDQVGLVVDEWGIWDQHLPQHRKEYGFLWQQSTMRSAVGAGLGLNIFNRQADKLVMCNIAQMVNVLQSILLTDGPEGRRCVRTTTYYAFLLFKAHRGNTAVRVEPQDTSPLALSASASKSANELVLSLVNPRYDQDMSIDCALHGAPVISGSAQILHDSDYNAFNSFDDPDRIIPRQHPIEIDESHIRLDVPRMSVITARVKIS